MLSVRVPPVELNISGFPPVLGDWVIKGLGMSSLVYATGHIKDPVPLIAKRRGLSSGGRFPPSFIHQVIIITGLNKLQLYVLALKMPTGRKPPLKLKITQTLGGSGSRNTMEMLFFSIRKTTISKTWSPVK